MLRNEQNCVLQKKRRLGWVESPTSKEICVLDIKSVADKQAYKFKSQGNAMCPSLLLSCFLGSIVLTGGDRNLALSSPFQC